MAAWILMKRCAAGHSSTPAARMLSPGTFSMVHGRSASHRRAHRSLHPLHEQVLLAVAPAVQ
eukprot:scaffold225767_cov24-Tisochrysis_lutea.AAC.1